MFGNSHSRRPQRNLDVVQRGDNVMEMSDNPSPAPLLGQIAITVADVAVAKVFYQNVLGVTPLFDAGPGLSFLKTGDVRVMLTTPQGHGEVGNNSVLYFKVSPIAETYERMVAAGAKAERETGLTAKMPDHGLWMGFVRDPDDNLVALMEEVRPPVATEE